jgi:hypothetical protein
VGAREGVFRGESEKNKNKTTRKKYHKTFLFFILNLIIYSNEIKNFLISIIMIKLFFSRSLLDCCFSPMVYFSLKNKVKCAFNAMHYKLNESEIKDPLANL